MRPLCILLISAVIGGFLLKSVPCAYAEKGRERGRNREIDRESDKGRIG